VGIHSRVLFIIAERISKSTLLRQLIHIQSFHRLTGIKSQLKGCIDWLGDTTAQSHKSTPTMFIPQFALYIQGTRVKS